ncbi:elongation factor G [Novosphingobium pentaromativorans]|uniref:Elongation factor G n=1 Tax=Novosphingobium pentaromativorans US6-1 TaxID=1088721 RepID=G6E9F2_9SPHN|nr:elongation factor G [Novosphingobium pentaromativorans]AIT81040.1 elongation factor G [Novosphingobium pentaromativorans US6-1]EHJ62051.1 elongation factor EF-G [Novosphingobium pentaromativorans US6-1]
MKATSNGAKVIALVGPTGAGKTSLAEAMLFAAGAITRLGAVKDGNSVGDASPEARSRGGSTELNLMRFGWMEEPFVLLDVPGAPGFSADAEQALAVADLALVVIDPDPVRGPQAEPILRQLEAMDIPRAIFVNRIDQARGSIEELLETLQPLSASALVARQIPIRDGEHIDGFVDLALERAYHYRPGKPSEQIPIPADLEAVETAARFHMLEQLADHDDVLLEQLLLDEVPRLDVIFGDLTRETAQGQAVPVLFGSAINGFGVRRLLKMLRHDTPPMEQAMERLGIGANTAQVFKIMNGSSVGRLALMRLFGGEVREGADWVDESGEAVRAGALFALQGSAANKLQQTDPGDVVGIAKLDDVCAGQRLGMAGNRPEPAEPPAMPPTNCALAIEVRDHKDEVRLSAAIGKLVEEDAGLAWAPDEMTHEMLIRGRTDEHLAVALERLKRRYGVDVSASAPAIPYRETIRKAVTQRGRHKKQSGGHGQFGDVVIEVRPLQRGEGFRFDERITGGAVPRQWIPSVEHGVRDAMESGPLGFEVVDVAVTLVDGSFHTVDSSELAFRLAGRLAMSEALAAAGPYLLEPFAHVAIRVPGSATSRVTSHLASRRGQMLGIVPLEGWSRWDVIEMLLPGAELAGLDGELRSLSQGMAQFVARFDHFAEVNGKLASAIIQSRLEPA